MSLDRRGLSDSAVVTMSANGWLQWGASHAVTIVIAASTVKTPAIIAAVAVRTSRTSRSGTATDSAKTSAAIARPTNGAQATNCELSSPNADGIAERRRAAAPRPAGKARHEPGRSVGVGPVAAQPPAGIRLLPEG